MKILIASFSFPPSKDGVSEAVATMARGFVAKGWEVHASALPTIPERISMDWHGVTIHEISIHGTGSLKRSYCGDVEVYRTLVRDGDWDAILFQTSGWPLMVVLDLLPRIRAKAILVSHGYAPLLWVRVKRFPYGLPTWFRDVLQSFKMPFWLRDIDRAVFLSERTDLHGFYDHFLAKLARHPGRRIIANGIDPGERGDGHSKFRSDHAIGANQMLFLCVANYSRRKDQGYAARAFRQAALADAVLVFVGSQFNEDYLRFRAEDDSLPGDKKLGRIVWLENLDRNTTLDAIAACDTLVLSANHEAQPIVLLEAMRESKPWIARAAGCITEMPGGIAVHSEREMAHEMTLLVSDAKRRDYLGKQGREAVEHFYNRKRYIDSYCELIMETCGKAN